MTADSKETFMALPDPQNSTGSAKADSKQRSVFPILMSYLVGVAILFTIALIWETTDDTRSASRRGLCNNNLKQIGLALHNYHEQYGCFPPRVRC